LKHGVDAVAIFLVMSTRYGAEGRPENNVLIFEKKVRLGLESSLPVLKPPV